MGFTYYFRATFKIQSQIKFELFRFRSTKSHLVRLQNLRVK